MEVISCTTTMTKPIYYNHDTQAPFNRLLSQQALDVYLCNAFMRKYFAKHMNEIMIKNVPCGAKEKRPFLLFYLQHNEP